MLRTIIAIHCLLFACAGETDPCVRARTGRFADLGQGHSDYILTRSENELIEEIPSIGLRTRSRLVWSDSCTYLAFDRTILSGSSMATQPTDTLLVRILRIDEQGFDYLARLSSLDPSWNGREHRGRQLFLDPAVIR